MLISSILIQNFRKLRRCHIDISNQTTLFVGANNSGKTSAMDAFNKFLASRSFVFNDITVSNRKTINEIGDNWIVPNCQQPSDLTEWDSIVPKMDIWLDVSDNEIHYVSDLIPTLKWKGGRLGVRLAFFPKNIAKFFDDYRREYQAARNTESADPDKKLASTLFPKDLCDFISERIASYFSLRAFILDPTKEKSDGQIQTNFGWECLTDNPLKGIVRVDIIDAQRGFSDPDSTGGDTKGQRLSKQMINYYRKHLDSEVAPTPEDLDILAAADGSRKAFDKALNQKFESAIKELEALGYPGVADPKLTLASKISTNHVLEHDSAVQYAISSSDDSLKLPEKYNGLGYQNLISMVFDLMEFRDSWTHKGKSPHSDSPIEPLHLVLVEEPEAHLHVQVQQVFIRKAYEVLTRETNFKTQLVISTHSSHIARECNFANLRYFKRLPENADCSVSTSEVINLSDVFGNGNETTRFVTRYLQTTHCDLFFADAVIMVEGAAENMLLPHFIHSKHLELYHRYISILSINGRHSHRLEPLIGKLCIPTLVITDIDPAENSEHNPGIMPERGKGYISGNYAITKWLLKEQDLDKLLDIKSDDKVINFDSPYNYSIRISYQTPIKVKINGSEKEYIPSTFEDSIIFTNYEMLKSLQSKDAEGMMKKVINTLNSSESFDKLCEKIYDMLHSKNSGASKADFALDVIYSLNPETLIIPQYIEEGLTWLQECLSKED